MKIYISVFLALFFFLPNLGGAQTLKRSAFLGIQMQPVPDSLRLSELGYRNGVLAGRVFPNSTASELGMESGDILLSIDDKDAVEQGSLQRSSHLTKLEMKWY